ncbi:predicted protein [Chaetomium globosum CBS 148.51]|uniref:Uncharacterized protein n=1 Tax=Chaetomium globosum (strain ATCC 6205 / CBS 148.51 / DSM 1962 / NBRC 6347 / NRRL 1970) TaxID=306901 RepID=Q2GU53_CHAGB|nr:uncharacterized protein CHGG_08501 [Chaetomium globosum CBS 148.51]EAQ84487.1 predicted protein [Chaetomium globosum CBS 148.51]
MAPILNRSNLGAIAFADGNGDHIRIYYQDAEGYIRETFYDNGNGWAQRPEDVIGKGKLNTGIAAIAWANGTQRCYSGGAAGGWYDGALTRARFQAAPYSQVGAVPFSVDNADIRVYYQDNENKVAEAVLQPATETWVKGNLDLPPAIPGTSISAVSSANRPNQRVWVYYQLANTQPVEYVLQPQRGWVVGGYNPSGTFAPGAYISAVHWGDYNINVFAVNDQNTVVRTAWTKAGSWQGTTALQTVITDAPVASIHVPTMADWIRAYTQPSGQLISELGSNDGGASFVTMQSTIPVDR